MQRYVFHTEGTSLSDIKVFYELALNNPDYQWERDSKGNIIFMSPTYSGTGKFNFKIAHLIEKWNETFKSGIVFDSSTGFTLLDGSVVSPDVSWIKKERWEQLSYEEQEEQFSPIVPDFVIEVMSKNDSLKQLQEKMRLYIENGVRLGWLIDRYNEKVYIYEAGSNEVKLIEGFAGKLSGGEVLEGFELDLEEIQKINNVKKK